VATIFGRRPGQPISWFHRSPVHSNQFCLYCARFVGEGSPLISDKEHLIGRKFVPPGSFDGDPFNFLFRACRECNGRKAAAERHISSVTLFNSPARIDDPNVDILARHKGERDFHPGKSGIRVKDAADTHQIQARLGSGLVTFTGTSPPQLMRDSVVSRAPKSKPSSHWSRPLILATH
jgi:hypothetical protein